MAMIVRPGNRLMALSFESNINAFRDYLHEQDRWVLPYVTSAALNDTVVEAREAEKKKIAGVFDRPTRFTQNSPLYRKASRKHLVAEVFIRDEAHKGTPPSRYLRPQVMGGPRRAKPFEMRLRRAGIMRPDEFAVPAIGYKRNAYGNLPGSTIMRILSQLQAAGSSGAMQNETSRSRKRKRRQSRFFVPAGSWRQDRGLNRLPRGIYERMANGTIRAVMMFVSQPVYRQRYDFGQAAEAKARRVFPAHWANRFRLMSAKKGISLRTTPL